ncbi:hypothetical protein G5B37_10055 [Rasiella rasia]|uniref:Outer membrane protein beta-barrel domain-containing protein n=1 Tax=Rasiella rasia TaxID=2744027 RepID=A0A6G6GMT4_9FLAO|nr:hypothetical protein [Rasiella rasia]QIE59895.1 hypothetical protein G5B37_10055 [Rasiella rasia]
MIRLKNVLFVTLLFFVFSTAIAQRNYDDYNRIGIQGGVSLFDISTSDFVTEQQTGFAAGFTTRGSFRNNFDLIYGLTFASNQIGIMGRPLTTSPLDVQSIKYTIPSVQLNFLGSYNIVKHHFSIEFGPILNVNGKMKLDSDRFENYIIDGYTTLRAQDIQDISPINFHVMGGATVGLESFRISAQYQYGVSNMLSKLDDKNLENDSFEGHSSTILLMAVVYF